MPPLEYTFPIFIRSLGGKLVSILIQNTYTIQELKSRFQARELLALEELDLYFEGKTLKDTDLISNCNIGRNSTLHISFRLRGGVVGRGVTSSSKPSFREAVDKRSIPVQPAESKPTEYIVEQSKQSPCVELTDPEIKDIYVAYSTRAIIYRFNEFWTKTEHLYQQIHNNWSTDCDISLC